MTLPRHLIVVVAAAACAAMVGCGSCKSGEPPPPKVVEDNAEAPKEEEPTHPFMQMREAFGMPFPPDVLYVKKRPGSVEVGTKLSYGELIKFFEGRVVDMEFVPSGNGNMRLIGLRSGMPNIWIFAAHRKMSKVLYIDRGPTQEQAGAVVEAKPLSTRKKGEPVEDRMPDGTLVAPGARWQEPYTPPPGSPLDQPRFRANFGKPYGTWVLN